MTMDPAHPDQEEAPMATTEPSSADRVRKVFAGYTGLYAPSVIAEAAQLLDALLDTAEQHGYGRQDEAAGWLVTAAAEAVSSKCRSTSGKRSYDEVNALTSTLTRELTARGLTLAPSAGRGAVAVEPVAGGPSWGLSGRAGLAVSLYTDGGWDITVNQLQSRVHAVHAPVTAEGAKEVADIVHGILHGMIADPFRR